METTQIDVDAPGGELLALAAYFAVLAYPESHRQRDRAVSAVLALMNRAARHHGKPLSPIASVLFREVTQRAQGELLGTGQKGMLPRIHRRLIAAGAAERMLEAAALGKSLSLNEVAEQSDYDRSYFMHVVWAGSKPVLHLALALRGVLMDWPDDGRPYFVQLLAKPSWVREAMKSAENWRAMLPLLREIDSDAFIRLVPADCADSTTTP